MILKVVFVLLCIFYKTKSETVATTQSTTTKYPCDNTIIFVYENTLALEESAYKKQINFLTDHVFEEWNNFNGLTLFSNGNESFKTNFKSKSDVKDYILKNKQTESNANACDIFSDLYDQRTPEFKSIVIFLREFDKNEVASRCNYFIKSLNSANNLILFVPLSNAVNVNGLKKYFSKSTILVWDIDNKDTPDDWENQFNKNFGCGRYPCNNDIFIGYETTTKLSASRYKKQINFLTKMLFENWTHFDEIAVFSYGKNIFKDAKSFTSKSQLTDFIAKDVQVKTRKTTCDTFSTIYPDIPYFNVVLFLREFNQKDVDEYCKSIIDELNKGPIAFVILSEDVIVEELQAYFPNAKIIEWDIDNKSAPDDWEAQFYDAYGCNPSETTTSINHLSTTTENPIDCCPCSKQVFIAYDKSNVLNGTEFKKVQNFLVDYVFQNWSHVDNLRLISFADSNTQDEFKYLKSKKLLDSFISNDKQVDEKPYLCEIFSLLNSEYVNIVFISEFTGSEVTEDCKPLSKYPANKFDFITIVAMTENVQFDLLNKYYPQAQFIKWNISGEATPQNWEWLFTEAYNCKKQDKSIYPCDNKILLGYDESLTTLNTLKEFLINNLFNKETWNVFENLELIAYSEYTRTQSFGSISNLNDIYNFINNGKTTNLKASLCRVFNELVSTYTLGVNIILFVSEFHEHQGDECPLWIQKVRNNANSITFVNLTKSVDTNYLLSKIPHANFISWNILEEKVPTDWEDQFFSAFGCENFFVESQTTYPCLNDIGIAFDRSRYLTPHAYQRLTNFLLTKLFINEWTNFDEHLLLLNYANDTTYLYPSSLLQTKYFIHQSLKTEEEPLTLCKVFKTFRTDSFNLVLFISKFGEHMINNDCFSDVKDINSYSKQITFIALTPLVNRTLLQQIFRNSTVVEWNIEQQPELTNWNQTLWDAFNCTDELPVQFPQSTSTVMPSTKHSTSGLSPTTLTSTPKISTSTLITTTILSSTLTTTTTQSPSNNTTAILLGIFIPLIIIILIVVIVCFCFYRRKQRQQLVSNMASNNHYKQHGKCNEDRELDQWEISLECLQINFLDKLGSGAFGDVYLGKINGPAPIRQIYNDSPHCQRFNNCEVAIKSLPSMQVDEYARNEFWKEIEFMKDLKFHQNLVCFLGYVYDPTSPLMLLEYCANGDLLKFIKTNKQKFVESFETTTDSDCKTLISFAWQISSGLEYLSSLDLIHRDVAARNILLDSQNVCKVSDFGLCRLAEDLTYQSKGGKLPIRWMALESLKDYVYSQKTDVWSYGVLLYELFTLGDLPYIHVENILAFIESGKRLDKPNYCSEDIYDLMSSCWLVDPEERPTFTELCQILAKMIETATMHYNYVDTLALIEEANIIEEIDI